MVGHDVFGAFEPPCRDQVQHLTFEGDGGEDTIERGETVRRDQDDLSLEGGMRMDMT